MSRHSRAWIGTSGWNYRSWRDVLYPSGLPQKEWLRHYAHEFDTVELNNSFYRIPDRHVMEGWSNEAPRRFRFAVKLWRGITHFKKLKDCREYVDNFLGIAGELDGRQRAPLLVQLPPNQKKDVDRLRSFLDSLKQFAGRRWKIAVEFRNEEWLCDEVYRLLDEKSAAICLHDMAGKAVTTEPNQASFVYVRRHGSHGGRYSGRYSRSQIRSDAKRIRGWLGDGRTVYLYYNNDAQGYAVRNARELREELRRE